ncbi:hypothetical protein Fmac_023959 [Flemingia macrophylla]|uniref:HhH-GPD domain-containing protein n=1 Tax=Flemingia macrophylla TaxID=520843 RepID=A0ABD1LN18_9FABA
MAEQHSRLSIMNFGKQLLGQDEQQFDMNNSWVPITPENLVLLRSNTPSDWPVNQMRRANYQENPVPGSDYMEEKLLYYQGPNQNLHLLGQTCRTGQIKTFDGNLADRNGVHDHIPSSYTQPWHYDSVRSNSAQRCNIHSAPDILFKEANRLLFPNRKSEFSDSNSSSLLNNDIHCSVPNQPEGIFSEIPYGESYQNYNLNYEPMAGADTTARFINSLQSVPKMMDQLKFVDNQFCTIPDYIIEESTSQEKDKQKDLISFAENEVQEYCDGLLKKIVDSSCAVISTTYGDQKGSDNIFSKASDLGFDLNKTPEQKAPQRRKHRPKVIVEGKPKRPPKSATKKTENKEKPRKKRKNVPKTAATPQTEIIEQSVDSTVATKISCRKALNFDLEHSKYESQSKIGCQQEIHHRIEKAFNTATNHKATEMLGGATISYGTNSVLLISSRDEHSVKNQRPRNIDENKLLLHGRQTNNCQSKRKSTTALSATTEEPQIKKFPVTEEGPANGNSDLYQEGNNGCMQQNIHAKEIDNILFQSETCFENSQNTEELICHNTLQLVPNIHSNSIKAKGSKRKYCKRTENQQDSATNSFHTSLCQEKLQADENFKYASPDKVVIQMQKIKKPQNRLSAKVGRRPSSQKMSKENPQNKRKRSKNGFQSQSNEEMVDICIESNRFLEQQNKGASIDISEEPHQIYSTLIDEIICQLNGLKLGESNIPEMEGQKALVSYNGDRSVVPYQEFELVKKLKPRPKVDLDQETERTWKLLMGKGGSEGPEGTDMEKEKWWEEERNVFHGRVDSFIARMHLIQGDRRFSKWKGSVVDSVIGVFLTQNVSDHLSSSAFMSLASRFPLQSKSSKKSYDVDTNTLLEEAQLCIVNPADTITPYGFGTLNQPTYHLGFETSHHARELWRDSETSRTNGSLIKPNNLGSEEEFLSSQDSLDSSITQDARIRSSSASNSDSEGLDCRCEPRKTQFSMSTNSLQVGQTTMFQEFYNSVNGVSLFEERNKDGQLHPAEHVKKNFGIGRNDSPNVCSAFSHPSNYAYPPMQLPVVPSTDHGLYYPDTQGLKSFQMNSGGFSWTETVSVHSEFQDNCRTFGNKKVGDNADKTPEMQYENGTLGSLELPTISPYGSLSKHLALPKDIYQFGSHKNYNQASPDHHLVIQKSLESESRAYTMSLSSSHILGRGQDNVSYDSWNIPKHAEGLDNEKIISAANSQGCSENSSAESIPQKQVYSSNTVDKKRKTKVSKARKAKPEADKKHGCDWDKLRKEVQVNRTEIERSTDTMDSLDYEAVRCASVKEISKTIKERGMNNMLAERIKEFLDRLVTDHGSIDLEWLRHVPQDKVKEYLLSIRGLGLKSVECVRLLTLHHMAFPVDTNVGRIAVRLGWVPLQPLPETLQLHLLELYVSSAGISSEISLAQIVYELHYQMITFGKVFCTKKKPNCNACPMRAECRHFASAFASARLALPGPEEKGIVSMHVPVAAERNYFVNKGPVVLPLLENNLSREVSPESTQCEPIIEEPATPEQVWTEVEESDIEDFFRDDPDEILSVELNTKQSATNIQNLLQEYKDHDEGDMSKALVALNSHSTYIPTPKLKNVSRLRTEHQVYELPDSHPLLENMNKREPDDPSPYLLAIWTPGETANSVQPPERRCGSQDSANMCNDNTCLSCNSIREANSQIVRGTLLIPCRTATRGSFPLNGTYFQVNEGMDMEFAKENSIFWDLSNINFQRPLNPRNPALLLERIASIIHVQHRNEIKRRISNGDLIKRNAHPDHFRPDFILQPVG